MKTRKLVMKPEFGLQMEDRALEYASSYSWKNQAKKHLELAEYATLLAERRFGYYPAPCEIAPAQSGSKLSGIRIA
jgi:hypothetical protein